MDKCSEHDKCISNIEDRLTAIKEEVDKILLCLEAGSGNFNLLNHRIGLLERLGFGLVGLICASVGMALMALILT